MRRQVVVTQRFFDDQAAAFLEGNGCEASLAALPSGQADTDVPIETLEGWLRDASGWIVGHARVTQDLLVACPTLKVIARRGVGFDRIDLDAVRSLGRVATIAAGGNEESVADQTIGLMIGLGRRFRESQQSLNAGSWSVPLGTDLYGKTVGVIGLGRIGRAVVRRLAAFDTRILVHTPRRNEGLALTLGFQYADLGTLLAVSDYITLHAPLTPSTRFMIRSETLKAMKPTAFLINTARGGLVEDRDLLAALSAGRLAGAGLDVFVSETDREYEEVTRALVGLPNVIALPHAGASTLESLERTNMIAARCVVAVLDGGSPPPECLIADGRP